MKIAECLLPIFILGMCTAEVYMGFEAEVRKFAMAESLPIDEPVISGTSWRLFTDSVCNDAYEPEFSTIGRLEIDTAIRAAKEIETTLSAMLNQVNSVSEQLANYKSFRALLSKRQEYISQLYECLKTDIKGEVDMSKAITELVDIYGCVYRLDELNSEEDKTEDKIQENLKNTTINAENYYEKHLKPYLTQDPSVLEIFDDPVLTNTYNMLKDNQKAAEELLIGYVFKLLLEKSIKKLMRLYVDSDYLIHEDLVEKLKEEIEESHDDSNDKVDELNHDSQLLDIVEYFDNTGRISYTFHPSDENLQPKDDFKAFCSYDGKTDFNFGLADESIGKYHVCPESKVNIGFQLTYETRLTSLTNLLRFYSSYSTVLNALEAEEILNKQYMPIELVKMANCLMNGESCLDFSYLNNNPRFDEIWQNKRPTLQGMIVEYYEVPNGRRDAEGLFYMVVSYALRIFNRIDISSHADNQKSSLTYGPKKNLPIMSRVAFSELFDNLERDKELFVALMSKLCDYNFETDKFVVEDISDTLNCSRLKLVDYELIGIYDSDQERYNAPEPVNFIEWVKSIVRSDKRLANQPKTEVETNKVVWSQETDIISPPPGFALIPDQVDESFENSPDSYEIYSMGAYTGIQPGHVLIELRSYSSLPITANNIETFIKGHAALLFKLLSVEEQITDFKIYHERLEKLRLDYMEQTELEAKLLADTIQQKRLLI